MGKGKVRVFLLRRRAVAALGALVLAGAIFYVVSCPPSIMTSSAQRQLPIYCVEREQKMCSVSFDAAWGNEDTKILIDILARYNVKATFFCVGDWAEKYPESVKALHDAGHEVMSHSNHHDHYNSLTAEEIVADVTASNQRIAASTGVTPTLIRCPYGEYDDHVISAIRSMGMEPIQWNVDSLDWKDYDAATITQRVTSSVGPGSIVLFHNAALHTPEALPDILEYLLGEGYAQSMGIHIRFFRVCIILLSSLLSACVTALAGPISFVGIAVPHITRLSLKTTKPVVTIPAIFLCGAVFCMFCDLIARTIFSPSELAIGTVTAVFGAPVVIWLMVKRQK